MVAPFYLIRLLTLKKRLALTLRALLGTASEEAEYDPGRSRIVVLMQVNAEGGPVIVDIEQTYLEVPVWVDIYSAAHFIRQTVVRGCVTTGPGDGGIRAGSPDQSFHKGGRAPSISCVAEETRSPMISIEHSLGATDGYYVVAGVRNNLKPRL